MDRNRSKKEHKPLSDRTITNHLLVIRTLYNRAKTARLISSEDYPIGGKEKISIKFGKTEKIGLVAEEINQLKHIQFNTHQKLCTIAEISGWLVFILPGCGLRMRCF